MIAAYYQQTDNKRLTVRSQWRLSLGRLAKQGLSLSTLHFKGSCLSPDGGHFILIARLYYRTLSEILLWIKPHKLLHDLIRALTSAPKTWICLKSFEGKIAVNSNTIWSFSHTYLSYSFRLQHKCALSSFYELDSQNCHTNYFFNVQDRCEISFQFPIGSIACFILQPAIKTNKNNYFNAITETRTWTYLVYVDRVK